MYCDDCHQKCCFVCGNCGCDGYPCKHVNKENVMVKKYYVGAKHIASAILNNRNADCTRATLEEAIKEATHQVRTGEVECAVVVEITHIVRRDFPPVTVEKV